MSPVEKQILSLFDAGDVKAMDLLYDHYSDALYGVVLRKVGDEAAASDILQESFVKIWKRSKQYDSSKGRLFTWLVRIVKNRAIDHLRASNRKMEIQSELRVVSKENTTQAVNPMVEHDLNILLSKLDQNHRQLIEHSYILGYSHLEIAEKFDLPIGTVKTRIRKGMIELRSLFGNGR
ncbi:MAG: sigma-70 family RNA polymerase sigma factor [Flavobacteriales bacterium]|nr:sigma-70 family RNA polymerase sigma factor [Flavobacteriales bacterium]